VDTAGFVRITDRTKDLIKSGGEWISSVDLENALMAHASIAEAAVIAIPDEKWSERPLACVVLKPGSSLLTTELNEHLLTMGFAKWQLPDRYQPLEAIPRTCYRNEGSRDRATQSYTNRNCSTKECKSFV
jgi:fatty-acyl-CoA synthase